MDVVNCCSIGLAFIIISATSVWILRNRLGSVMPSNVLRYSFYSSSGFLMMSFNKMKLPPEIRSVSSIASPWALGRWTIRQRRLPSCVLQWRYRKRPILLGHHASWKICEIGRSKATWLLLYEGASGSGGFRYLNNMMRRLEIRKSPSFENKSTHIVKLVVQIPLKMLRIWGCPTSSTEKHFGVVNFFLTTLESNLKRRLACGKRGAFQLHPLSWPNVARWSTDKASGQEVINHLLNLVRNVHPQTDING